MLHGLLKTFGSVISRNKLSTLIYHQVVAETDPMRPSEPNAQTFRWHMKLLRDNFTPIGLPEAVKKMKEGSLPSNAVCVTFDDGYLNNLEVAQPILEEFAIPATVYIATGYSEGGNMWNDRLIDLFAKPALSTIKLEAIGMDEVSLGDWQDRREKAYSLIPKIKYRDYRERMTILDQMYKDNQVDEAPHHMMTPEQVKELAGKGVDIGAHTVDHPILKSQTAQEQLNQIKKSKEQLEQWLQKEVTGFAYPNGKPGADYDECAVNVTCDLGFQYAVSTQWGISTENTDVFQLNRFTPWDNSALKFHARLLKNTL